MNDEIEVVRIGTWRRMDGETGEITTGDDFILARAVSAALAVNANGYRDSLIDERDVKFVQLQSRI